MTEKFPYKRPPTIILCPSTTPARPRTSPVFPRMSKRPSSLGVAPAVYSTVPRTGGLGPTKKLASGRSLWMSPPPDPGSLPRSSETHLLPRSSVPSAVGGPTRGTSFQGGVVDLSQNPESGISFESETNAAPKVSSPDQFFASIPTRTHGLDVPSSSTLAVSSPKTSYKPDNPRVSLPPRFPDYRLRSDTGTHARSHSLPHYFQPGPTQPDIFPYFRPTRPLLSEVSPPVEATPITKQSPQKLDGQERLSLPLLSVTVPNSRLSWSLDHFDSPNEERQELLTTPPLSDDSGLEDLPSLLPSPPPPSDLVSDRPTLPSSPPPECDTNSSAPAPANERFLEPFSRSSPLCLDGQISGQSKYVVSSGGYADIWTGSFRNETVAIKVMRPFSAFGSHIEISKILKRSWREYLAWSRLHHPNILECLGFSYDFSPQTGQPSLVSPWMSNGTAIDYIKKYPNVDRVRIVLDIARGLVYLHDMKPTIVHGDLRAGNVLISDRGIACLSDFGLSKVLNDVRGLTTSSEVAGSVRWMAPELLQESRQSVQSDVWAYGMTVLEISTGTRPYSETATEASVLLKILKGELPARPEDDALLLPDDIWMLCQKCWQILPDKRPSIPEVLADIEDLRRGLSLLRLRIAISAV